MFNKYIVAFRRFWRIGSCGSAVLRPPESFEVGAGDREGGDGNEARVDGVLVKEDFFGDFLLEAFRDGRTVLAGEADAI